MQKKIFASFLLSVCISSVKAQCPSTLFSIPDTLCAGVPLPINNLTAGASFYEWDFCLSGDFSPPSPADTFTSVQGINYGVETVNDSGNFYAFYIAGNDLIRLEFGNSISNTPVTTSLGSFGNYMLEAKGLTMIKEGNTWFAIVINTAPAIFKLEFSSGLNNPPVFTPYSVTGTLSPGHFFIDAGFDGTNYVAVSPQNGSDQVAVFNLGNSLTGNNVTCTYFTNPTTGVYGISLAKDCDDWYGFISHNNSGLIHRLEFGNSLTNTPAIVPLAGSAPYMLEDIEVFREGGHWYAISVDNNGGFNYCLIDLDSLTNNTVQAAGYANAFATVIGFSVINDNGQWYIFTGNYFASLAVNYSFAFSCDAAIAGSNDLAPQNVTFSNPGTHFVNLAAYDSLGNISFFTDSVFINAAPDAGFSYGNACENSPLIFTDTSTIQGGSILSWFWDFDDGFTSSLQNPVHTYSAAGMYGVSLTVTADNGCSTTIIDSVLVGTNPSVDFSFVNNTCSNIPVQFSDSTFDNFGVASWLWNFGDGNTSGLQHPVHLYASGGTFQVTLSATSVSGCVDSLAQSITLLQSPESGFNATGTCVGETVTFNNTSLFSNSSTWDFGDGSTANTISPQHAYAAVTGDYTVTLISANSNGCSDTAVQQIHIGNKPVPAFSFNPATACEGNIVQFTDLTTVGGSDTINSWHWDFGDGDSSLASNPAHVYASSGSYPVTLTVTSPTHCDTSVVDTVFVIDSPTALFTFNNACEGNTICFTDVSITPPGSVITDYNWSFGDAGIDSVQHPCHLYATGGLFDVTLFVVNNSGCSDSVTITAQVYHKPAANFTNGISCSGNPTCFSDQSTVQSASITSWLWNFGDGATSLLQNPCHTYSTSISFNVSLIAFSSQGCADTIVIPLSVNKSPQSSFSSTAVCLGDATAFTYSEPNTPFLATNWLWNFGDLTPNSTLQNPSHTYSSPGSYTVTLTASNLFSSCSTQVSQTITVHPVPVPDFAVAAQGCTNSPYLFTDLSTGTIIQYSWNFAGLGTSASQNPSYLFSAAGVYPVQLSITTNAGCSDSVTKNVTINAAPVAAFVSNVSFGSPPLNVAFTNQSTGATQYSWNFGDNSTSTASSPTHVYADTGLYSVNLIASGSTGCSDTSYSLVMVLNEFLDIAVGELNAMRSNGLVSLQADVLNTGNTPVMNFEIIGEVQNAGTIHEYWTGTLVPGGSLIYTFKAKLEVPLTSQSLYVCVETQSPNGTQPDADPANDRQCRSLAEGCQLLNVFFNSTTNEVTVTFSTPSAGETGIEIHDMAGNIIQSLPGYSASAGLNAVSFDAKGMQRGVYAVSFLCKEDRIVTRFLKN